MPRHESGTQVNETTVEVIVDYGITGRVIIKNNKDEVVYIMSNEGHPTQWASVNPDGHTGRRLVHARQYVSYSQRVQDDHTKHPGHRRSHGAQQAQGEAQELGRGPATG